VGACLAGCAGARSFQPGNPSATPQWGSTSRAEPDFANAAPPSCACCIAPPPGSLTRAERLLSALPGVIGTGGRKTRAPKGSEIRLVGRAAYVAPPADDVSFIGEGTGEGIVVTLRGTGDDDFEGDVWFEASIEQSSHEEKGSARAAVYRRVAIGGRWVQPGWRWMEPYFSLGAGYHEFAVSGGRSMALTGAYAGAGVEFLAGRTGLLHLEARANLLWGTRTDEVRKPGGSSFAFAAGLGARF